MTEGLRLLLVAAEPPLVERVEAALAESDDGGRFRLACATGLDEAMGRAGRGEVDAVLLALTGAGDGILPLVELRAGAPDVPLVVLASAGDEPLAVKAVQLGATDYLVTDQLYGTSLVRCVQHAVEVERVRAQLKLHQAQWPPSLRPASEADGRIASLRAALPRSFDQLAGEYGRLLDQAVEQVLYRVDRPLEAGMRSLAERAGELRAGPRDLVEIHATAIKGREQEAGPQRMRLYLAEGQVRLLELMGHLVSFYRRLSSPPEVPPP